VGIPGRWEVRDGKKRRIEERRLANAKEEDFCQREKKEKDRSGPSRCVVLKGAKRAKKKAQESRKKRARKEAFSLKNSSAEERGRPTPPPPQTPPKKKTKNPPPHSAEKKKGALRNLGPGVLTHLELPTT